uniref:Uncharacterized protein n=1 Tax=Eptatretus burgeri TaxID=7764 RepID=A0A8C4X1B9_EPTBU
MASAVELRFLVLRKELHKLGFKEPLGLESVPLVEKLCSDLVHMTENWHNAKQEVAKSLKEARNVDTALEPVQTDNRRLVRENNELHLKFEFLHKVQALEKVGSIKSDKIAQLQEKNMEAVNTFFVFCTVKLPAKNSLQV